MVNVTALRTAFLRRKRAATDPRRTDLIESMASKTQGQPATGFENKTPCCRGVLSALRRYVLQTNK